MNWLLPRAQYLNDFNRGLLVVSSKLWYKVKLIFVKNTHAYRHVW